jgi:serine acetyltransferase
VGLGSVVVGAIEETHALIAGVPAKVLKRDYDWKSRNEEAVLS